jgi:frataxin-like iron-binding protein CyaY
MHHNFNSGLQDEKPQNEQFAKNVSDLLMRLEKAFTELSRSNDQGKITVKRVKPSELEVKVLKIGTYRMYSDESTQYLYLQSP